MQSENAIQYRSPRVLAYLAMFFLGSLFVTNLLSMFFGFGEIFFSRTIELDGGEYMSVWFLLIGLISILELFLYVAAVVLFLVWLFRVYKNLTPLRSPNQEYTPGWAVGWWFIPFANLVKPFQVVREAWQESDPDFDPSLNFLSHSNGSAPTFLGFWWAFWLLSNITTNIASRMMDSDNSVMTSGFAVVWIIASILSMIAAILAVLVVKSITARQDERYQNLFKLQVYSPPPPPNFNQPNFNQANFNQPNQTF
ncbi:MAG TPA: DUF4328 domain-containing protein [Pyrinomonadaceae bacterium]|jgi:hypothetical protein